MLRILTTALVAAGLILAPTVAHAATVAPWGPVCRTITILVRPHQDPHVRGGYKVTTYSVTVCTRWVWHGRD